MHVIALVKHVPDIQSARSFTASGLLARGGPDDTLNELDEDCLEAALRIVEAVPSTVADEDDDGSRADPGAAHPVGHRVDHRVTALTVGPPAAVGALRRALAMGATSAVHVCDEAIAGSDAIATARVIAAAVEHLHAEHPVDVVIAGMAALDGLTSLVPSAVSALLDWPQLTLADRVSVTSQAGRTTVRARRVTAHHVEELQAPAPVVVSVTDATFRPRSPDMRGLLAARRKPVTVLDLAALGLEPASVGRAGSATRVLEATPRPERSDAVRLTGGPGLAPELAAELAGHLAQRGFC
ncbi:electron transfer flavoprotein beta subunit [Quadrisphaera granulorum]|uniref:Electron transfer flavoprotein beta subunit n=1 Tax=Quadrisphaera granulorum TaxID=317664 RepID=A0A315ZKT3_9ACTN|nr:electron transfer flavoprotein subunit beta/FixA family protein [Quadrisphaera granulorum]PWJ45620.1 electron transfer flavoprotein beta subunit [Quadrisphaera granulorum]SZE99151.1 electron transfer flavoprotein beta subunit [Quadrisphaera granulorum]